MTSMKNMAERFFDACESGKGWESCNEYVMEFEGNRISHMTKVWNDGVSLKQLGWA